MSSWSETLYRNWLIPCFEQGIKRRKTRKYLHQLQSSQWLDRAQLDRLQWLGLQRLLQHAYRHCPYYRRQWQTRGLHPRQLQSRADFASWPLLQRDAVAQHRRDLRAQLPALRLLSKSTGGSSGAPLHFDLDCDSNDRRTAAAHRGYAWMGAPLGSRQAYLWGRSLGACSRWSRWKEAAYHRFLYRRLMLDSFQLRDDTVDVFLARLNAFRPTAIVAYTGPLYELARSLDDRGLRPYRPQNIIVGAEKLHDFQRRQIEQTFAAPVYESYGSREFMLIGAECERREGLHLTAENLLVEIVDQQGRPCAEGVEGDVVITDLTNYGMPFIRYLIGDRAVAGWTTCSCGRGLPLLRKVVGRRLDVLYTLDGRRIPGEFFPHLLKEFPGVRRFQVVQEQLQQIELKIVVGQPWGAGEAEQLAAQVTQAVGQSTRCRIRVVDHIPLSAAGKRQVVINKLPAPTAPPRCRTAV